MPVYDRLEDLGISLPPATAPAAAFVPWVRCGDLLFVSGHIARKDGKPWCGQLGVSLSTVGGKVARLNEDAPATAVEQGAHAW
jgi:hypothetical protein